MALTKITPQMFDTSATAHDLNVDNGTFVVDGSASRVGIGTATPSTLLDVNGALTATTIAGTLTTAAQTNITSVGTLSSLTVSGALNGTLSTAAQPNITSVGTLTGLTVSGNATAQNVINIATDSTIQTTSSRQWATIKNTGTGTGDYSEMKISNDNDDYIILGSIGSGYSSADWSSSSYIYANRELRIKSSQGIRFYSGGFTHGTNDYMILEQAGNLGIGITSGISSKLHVNAEMSLGPDANNRGIINYGSNILSFGTRQSSTNYFNTLRVTSGKVGIGTDTPNQKLDIEDGHIRLTPGYGIRWETDAGGYAGQLSEDTNNNLLFYAESDGSNPTFVIKNSNRFIGIGESNPDAPLHITSNTPIISFDESDASQEYRIGSFGGAFAIYDSTDSLYRFTITGDGKVGIGQSNPSATLDIVGGGTNTNPTLELNSSTSNGFNHAINAFNSNLTAGENHTFFVGKEGSTKNSGYIGYKWNGAASNTNLLTFGHWANDNIMNLTADGKFGIGTQSPGETLDVIGSAHVGVATATVNFTDSVSNGNTKYIEIGANGSSSLGDALLVCHSSGSGVGYLGYESGNDRLIIACDNGGGNNKIDLSVNAGTGTGGSTDNLNAATPALRVHGNGNVGIHGVTSPQADLHVGHGGQEWRTSHGGNNLYTTNTSWGGDLTGDPNFYYGAPSGILVTSTDSSTTGPTYPGLTLYNNDNTAGGWSPMLIFAKAESGSSPYKASMAAIYARAPLGTGNSDAWIDGELWFGTSGAATNGVRGRMVLEKEGHLRPASDNTYDLGTTSYRWRNVYTTDLHLSNKVPEGTTGTDGEPIDAGNDVDGTTGDWTIQEGAEDLYIINNSTGKKYKFNLTEV